MEQKQTKELTIEDKILQVFKDSGLSVNNKTLMEKFKVGEPYLISLRGRIKNNHIKLPE